MRAGHGDRRSRHVPASVGVGSGRCGDRPASRSWQRTRSGARRLGVEDSGGGGIVAADDVPLRKRPGALEAHSRRGTVGAPRRDRGEAREWRSRRCGVQRGTLVSGFYVSLLKTVTYGDVRAPSAGTSLVGPGASGSLRPTASPRSVGHHRRCRIAGVVLEIDPALGNHIRRLPEAVVLGQTAWSWGSPRLADDHRHPDQGAHLLEARSRSGSKPTGTWCAGTSIELHRMSPARWMTLLDVDRCTLDPDRIEREIAEVEPAAAIRIASDGWPRGRRPWPPGPGSRPATA